ncbi:Pimeloyl-ACP methyl ester carboxylesterase [Micromonospora matsumotoense]|uniref:Pimeloyl-ACP methyl ester carboxylesterase n=1 Tax=Micromonospora matsumotoense TaxID=121616 RepID=A0A1C5AK00_9ACTN|nr:alpha/beta hydrolase [Micromonospora matsumotoense]SCF45568.1 Pimeloyl-ACP methyl ester carboxylesterase [Micromonospora matsumotoense]
MADRFTVHLYNRRGRADAAARAEPYDGDQDVDDLATLLTATGVRNVLGHSGGGFVALRAAARGLPIDRLALYDAAVQVNGLFPLDWVPAAREASHAGDIARALALTGAGLNTHSAAPRLPLAVRIAICRLFLRTTIGRTMGELLPTTLDESMLIPQHDSSPQRWAGITAEVLPAYGSSGPPYYRPTNEALARVMPHAARWRCPAPATTRSTAPRDTCSMRSPTFFTTPAPRSGPARDQPTASARCPGDGSRHAGATRAGASGSPGREPGTAGHRHERVRRAARLLPVGRRGSPPGLR